jgi:glycine cleavage system H protein
MKVRLPEDYHFTPEHEWAHVDENLVTVGLTEFALTRLGEVLFLELPEEGDRVTQSFSFGVSESVKNVRDLVSPVSGIVVEVNSGLLENPGLLNDDPYGEGWLIRIELEDEKYLAPLIRSPEYAKLVSEPK